MNKLSLSTALVLSALFSLSAIAAPKLGDKAEYAATITLNGQVTTATAVLELMQQDGAKFLQRTTVTHAGKEPKVTDEWKETDALLSDAKIDEILANCVKEGGKSGSITVPAGTFAACEIAFEDDEAKGADWIAKVPFGTVRSMYTLKADGKVVDLMLKSFK